MQTHETLYDSMRKRGVGFDVDKEFNSPGLFVGAAVTLQVSVLNWASKRVTYTHPTECKCALYTRVKYPMCKI